MGSVLFVPENLDMLGNLLPHAPIWPCDHELREILGPTDIARYTEGAGQPWKTAPDEDSMKPRRNEVKP